MSEYMPTIEELRRAYQMIFVESRREVAGAEFDRGLAAHDAAVRAQGHHVVPCARCGQRPVVANDSLNSDIVVCGDCGVQIGLHELPELRASVVPEEPDWQYGYASIADAEAEHPTMRRRKAGPWMPVEQEAENDG